MIYIRALRELFQGFKPDDPWIAWKHYAQAMGRLAAAYPSDLEAKVFHALALIAAQSPADTHLIETRAAVRILTPLLAKYPDHPGIAHYLIHACDSPQLAREGLEAARRYATGPALKELEHVRTLATTTLN